MKNCLKKIKAIITALWITVGSFCFKVMAQLGWVEKDGPTAGIAPYPWTTPYPHWTTPLFTSPWWIAIKIAQRTLIGVTIIVWIISLVKIKKTDDKVQRKKRIKRTIIIISMLIVLLVAVFLIPALLLKK